MPTFTMLSSPVAPRSKTASRASKRGDFGVIRGVIAPHSAASNGRWSAPDCRSTSERASTETIAGCIAFVAACDPTVQISDQVRLSLYRAAIRTTLTEARKLGANRPSVVELSSRKLAALLGIGYNAARVRLDNATEAGAVIDIGATDKD